jgi:hypothetical protein
MDRERARGVAGGLVDMNGLLAQMEFPFLQVKIDSKFWQGLSHHLEEKFPALEKVALLLPVHGNLNRFVQKGFQPFKMVWMSVGQDDQINLFWRDSVSSHLTKEIGEVTGMTRIDEKGYFSIDQISVAVVFVGILPKVGIEVFFNFHPVELPLTV